MSKIAEYKCLVDERKVCNRCLHLGLTNPARFEGGRFDSAQIGPWSLWQGNLNAPLMVVGQDWGTTDYFERNRGRDIRGNPTDLNLINLVKTIGFPIQDVYLPEGQNVLFFTNAVLCLKSGNLQSEVQKDWFINCSSFLRRQIEIVNPLAVVGLGKHAYDAILSCYNLKAGKFRPEVEAENGRVLLNGIHVFAVYHCGNKSTNMNRSMEVQIKDWMRIQKFIEKKCKPLP
jgi:DNA polymerase